MEQVLKRHVVALIGNGVIPLDAIGPMELLGRLPHADSRYASITGGDVKALRGPLRIAETHRLRDVGSPSVLIIAGGSEQADQVTLDWIRKSAAGADFVLASGQGRAWLDRAGVRADGTRIMAVAGGAEAIDAALAATARLSDDLHAQGLQLGIEYDPAPPFKGDLAAVAPASDTRPLHVDILLYEGMTALDAIGPYEVFSRVPGAEIRLVGLKAGSINTDTGALFFKVDHGLADKRPVDLVIVPGGSFGTQQAAKDPAIKQWLDAHLAVSDRRIMSICTGALILAATGALKGLTATTHWASADSLNEAGAKFVHARYVEHGRLVTAAGVSAGIDVALAIAGEMRGQAVGATIQQGLPYAPRPSFDSGSLHKATAEIQERALSELQANALRSMARMTIRSLV